MRIVVAFGLILLAMAFAGPAARAGSDCCIVGPLPAVIYGLPPLPYAISPTYALIPWTAAKPSCIVDQGPQLPARAYPTCLQAGSGRTGWPSYGLPVCELRSGTAI